MFDMGFGELVIIFVLGLLILGPERLPTAVRTVSTLIKRLRRSFDSLREEIEREVNVDEFKADLHNARIMEELSEKELKENLELMERDLQKGVDELNKTVSDK